MTAYPPGSVIVLPGGTSRVATAAVPVALVPPGQGTSQGFYGRDGNAPGGTVEA